MTLNDLKTDDFIDGRNAGYSRGYADGLLDAEPTPADEWPVFPQPQPISDYVKEYCKCNHLKP